jgi:putative membrane protein
MRKFLIRAVINAIAIAITGALVGGVQVQNNIMTYLILGIIITIINATVKRILSFISFPITVITLGLFILVINALMLGLAAWLSGGMLDVNGWWPALLGGIVMAIVNMVLERLTGTTDQVPATSIKK